MVGFVVNLQCHQIQLGLDLKYGVRVVKDQVDVAVNNRHNLVALALM
jgi:hypothetical protein